MTLSPKKLKLRTKMMILSFISVFLAILVGGLLAVNRIAQTMENEMGKRAVSIAHTLAQTASISQNIENVRGWEKIQPLTEKTRAATGVQYIAVINMEGIFQSHPAAERIGKHFSSDGVIPALTDKEYISSMRGTAGTSIRAFVPVMTENEERQAGMVVVGITAPTFLSIYKSIRFEVYFVLLIASALGFAGSVFLSGRLKKTMLWMEPEEIARVLKEQTAILQALGEGIIAVDNSHRITVFNDAASRILGIKNHDLIGKPIEDTLKDSHLLRVLEKGEPEYNQESVLDNTVIISNRVPVFVNGEVVGAVATFRDRTEINLLAEELTGVKAFVEALRVQNHEHLNRLHTIAGLVQLKQYQEAIDYIFNITEDQQNITSFLSSRINDNSVAGLIMGKYSRAKEMRIDMTIDKNSRLKRLPGKMDSNTLVVIIGNLLENAMDALKKARGVPKLYFSITESKHFLTIIVHDSGPGIPDEIRSHIFEKGFSTKAEEGHGLGLHNVKRQVSAAGGTISVHCLPEQGTRFEINIPY